MSALESVVAVSLGNQSISLREALHLSKLTGQLTRLLEQALQDRLIAEGARTAGLQVSDEELQKASDTFRQVRGLRKAADTLAWLESHHLTLRDFQTLVERPLLRKKLAAHLAAGKVEPYFLEHRAEFDRVRLSQIVVEIEGQAAELWGKIAEGRTDFVTLAREYSLDRESRPSGGFLGVVGRKSLSGPVEAAVFGAKSGDVVGPFKTPQGFHLIRIEEIYRAELDEKTTETIRNRLFEDWLRQRTEQVQARLVLFDLL